MNVLAALHELVLAATVPKDHIAYKIAINYRIPLQTAIQRWNFAKKSAKRQKREGDMFFALSVVDKMRTEPVFKKGDSRLRISRRREPKLVSPPGSMSLVKKSKATARIHVFKKPKKRRLLMDMEHIRDRLKRRLHKPHVTSLQKIRRRKARELWERRNKVLLERRKQFLRQYWQTHGHS